MANTVSNHIAETAVGVTMKGNPVQLSGKKLRVGDKAPSFEAVDNSLGAVSGEDFAGTTRVILAVPSLDTSVCATEARRFNQEATKLGDVKVMVVSMDLPFAQKRWCAAEGVANVQTLSDHRGASFGQNYGVLIEDLRLLGRAVFVVGPDDKIQYIQVVNEIAQEPDYDAALMAARKAAGK